ncbi:hypothetical protein GCM10007049_01510 [Echinicola pacifica]|uniref:FecR family protein n=1 Tax=Echinicola pacifica TaxID=346377 RepID=A0A918UJ13_9BACT|nr:FecR domain-containing protein [Echinicola pacifica]GGZ13405.1 hypothetical protein GCM10007049_01510 [Echinicola pacifica]
MPQIKDLIEDLEFIRWVKNPDDKLNQYWEHWLSANPERLADVQLAKEILLNLKFPSKASGENDQKEVLNRLLSPQLPAAKEPKTSRGLWGRIGQMGKVAAILIFLFLLTVLLHDFYKPLKEENPMVAIQWITKSTLPGEKLNFRLPDGSVVWLNSGSSLSFPVSFDSSVRHVKLQGEGFFEVKEDANHPFQVQTTNLLTTVLGTSFNINESSTSLSSVALLTGKVAIDELETGKEYILSPGQQLEYDAIQKNSEIQNFDMELIESWRKGLLIFRQTPFDQVKSQLEMWYGVKIVVSGKVPATWRFTGKFEQQMLETILISMSHIEGFKYQINDKEVRISFP